MGTKANLAERCAATSREIEETRGRISAAKDVLKERLRPQSLLNPIRARLKDTLGEGGEKILDTFRENPVPLALTGIGLGWLLLRDLRAKRAPEVPEGGSGLERMKETAGEAMGKTREAASKVRDAVSAVPGKIREGVRSTSDWFSSMMEENPMIVAVGVLAVGMVAGLSIPVSAKEEEVAGKAAEAALAKGAEVLEKAGEGSPAPEESKAPTGLPEGPQSAE